MVLRIGTKSKAVGLVKFRFDNLKYTIDSYYSQPHTGSPDGFAPWGVNTPGNLYDLIMLLNVTGFQNWINSYAGPSGTKIKVDGVYGDQTAWCLTLAEQEYGIHY